MINQAAFNCWTLAIREKLRDTELKTPIRELVYDYGRNLCTKDQLDEISHWFNLSVIFPDEQTQPKSSKTDAQLVADLVLLVGRLVQQVRKHEKDNDVVDKAMGYLNRNDINPAILRGIKDNLKLPVNDNESTCRGQSCDGDCDDLNCRPHN